MQLPGRLRLQTSPLRLRSPKLLFGHILSQALPGIAVPDKVLLPERLLPQAASLTVSANFKRLVQVCGIAAFYLVETGEMHLPEGPLLRLVVRRCTCRLAGARMGTSPHRGAASVGAVYGPEN